MYSVLHSFTLSDMRKTTGADNRIHFRLSNPKLRAFIDSEMKRRKQDESETVRQLLAESMSKSTKQATK